MGDYDIYNHLYLRTPPPPGFLIPPLEPPMNMPLMKVPGDSRMTLDVDKMRRQMARDTPDSVWMTICIESEADTHRFNKWRDHWAQMMNIKHKNIMTMTLYTTDLLDKPGYVRIQLSIT